MGRIDGTKLKLDPLKRIEPHAMKRRCDSEVYLTLQYTVTKTLAFIERFNQNLGDEERLKIFHVFLCALVRSCALHPELNRFIAGRHYWQRNEILLSFVIKKELKYKSEETLTKVQFSPFETLDTVRKKIYTFVNEARSDKGSEAQGQIDFFGKLPRFMLMFATKMIEILEFFGSMPKGMVRTDPLYTSAVIANLGSVRIKGGVLHHSYMYGTASLFITINRIHKAPVVDEKTNEIKVEDVIDFGFTIDERISEGFSLGEVLQDFRRFIENPELLLEIPVIPEDRLKELQLKDLDKDTLYQQYLARNKA
jgi:hypothetical protein